MSHWADDSKKDKHILYYQTDNYNTHDYRQTNMTDW